MMALHWTQEDLVIPDTGCELELTAADERLCIPVTHCSAIQHTQGFQFVINPRFVLDSLEGGQFVNGELIALPIVIPNSSAVF